MLDSDWLLDVPKCAVIFQ